MTAADLGLSGAKMGRPAKSAATTTKVIAKKGVTSAAGKVAVKYRDSEGNAWTGRGLQPRWLKAAIAGGKSIDDFKV